MGGKLLWGGLTCIVALSQFAAILTLVGAIIMTVGCVLYLFDK
jgi:hypothetical protein